MNHFHPSDLPPTVRSAPKNPTDRTVTCTKSPRVPHTPMEIKIAPSAFLMLLGSLLADRSHLCLAALLAAAFHELGHLLFAAWLHIPLTSIRLDFLGARLRTKGKLLSYSDEWLLSAAGPLFSLILSALPAFFWKTCRFAVLLSCASLFLGILNLLPIRSFDGGRMLSAALSCKFGVAAAERFLNGTTFFCIFCLWSMAVYVLLKVGDGLSLFAFSMSLFPACFPDREGNGRMPL